MSTYEQKRLEKAGDGTANYVTSKTLTTTFAEISTGTAFIDCANWDEMTIYLFFDPQTLGHILNTRVDFSADQVSWAPEADEVVTIGIAKQLPKSRTYTSLTADEEAVPVISIPLNDRWARIMVNNTAGTTGTVRAQVILSKVGS